MSNSIAYEIMHTNKKIAQVCTNGNCKIYNELFMPYNLFLQDTSGDEIEIDTRMDNLTNFYYWCASRLLTLDRKYAKELLNSIGCMQPRTDKERAQIALSYHCLSLTDVYWVKTVDECVTFSALNLYDNSLSDALVDISLRGKNMTVNNAHLLADNLATDGVFPKAWIREKNDNRVIFYLLKGGEEQAVENELLASKICQCFACSQVVYEMADFDGEKVSKSRIFTSKKHGIVSRQAFEIFAVNHDIDALEFILELDAYSYYMMNILDYLTGNTDRHWGNWGFLIDNETNKPLSLHPLMDFNQAFHAYDTIDGANCITGKNRAVSQREAAREAVKQVGLNQICAIKKEWFHEKEQVYDMFVHRLAELDSRSGSAKKF